MILDKEEDRQILVNALHLTAKTIIQGADDTSTRNQVQLNDLLRRVAAAAVAAPAEAASGAVGRVKVS